MLQETTARIKPKWITDMTLMPNYNKIIVGTGWVPVQSSLYSLQDTLSSWKTVALAVVEQFMYGLVNCYVRPSEDSHLAMRFKTYFIFIYVTDSKSTKFVNCREI